MVFGRCPSPGVSISAGVSGSDQLGEGLGRWGKGGSDRHGTHLS